ncbi:helix-turn-helix domain-containing protein [Cohnella sp. GCM10027633]|uniref:AraC family transcriptional regulator n=1 Tax=unclassified Cohnella TaxID=2636738 RepID=UPI00362FDED6
MELSEWTMTLEMHHYWFRKERFALAVDRYGLWTAFLVAEGKFAYRIGEQAGEAGAGDIVFCPPDTPFHRETISPLTFHFVHFRWSGSGAQPELDAPEVPSLKLHVMRKERFADNLKSLHRYAAEWDAFSRAMRSHLLNDCWLLACESLRLMPGTSLGESGNAKLNELTGWMNRHLGEPFRLQDVAALAGWSPVRFTREFQAAYRIKPSQYVKQRRVERAKSLLAATDWTLDRIAAECGFENGYYLSRVFSQAVGMSPSRYRLSSRV